MDKILSIVLVTLFAWALYEIAQNNREAMGACQETRSYDTCARNILR